MSCPTCGRRSTSLVLPEGFEYDPPVRGGAAPPGGQLDAPVQRQLPIRLNQAWKDFIDRHGDVSIPNQGAVVADGAEANLVLNLETSQTHPCLLYTSPSPRDRTRSRMPSSA